MDFAVTGLQSLLLEVVCWDKDRFGKDYMVCLVFSSLSAAGLG